MAVPALTWYELTTADKTKGVEFYSAVFGYETSEMDMGEMGMYTMFHHKGDPFAGLMEMKGPEWEGIPPHWMTYFSTSDINATCERIKEAGGAVMHGPFPISVGMIAVVKDDQGAVFSLHQPNSEDSEKTSAVTWVEHQSVDSGKADSFYKAVFGWEVSHSEMPNIGTYSMYGPSNGQFAGAMSLPSEMGVPSNWMVYLYTDDLEAALAKSRELGATVHGEVMAIPEVGHIAMVQDPTGAVVAYHQPSYPAS
jgi:predicted enzyme related to lactoylglutathione lyase